MGTNYAGSQKQNNANSVQAEIEKAMGIYFRTQFDLTGSSRTDAGVHALQNFYHFDTSLVLEGPESSKTLYHLNAILPADIVVKSLRPVNLESHSRFDAVARTYEYGLYQEKNPFLQDRCFYYPFPLNIERLNDLSSAITRNTDFQTFAKKNSQVHTFICSVMESHWEIRDERIVYTVKANRFLRGMVKGLVGTMLRSALKRLSKEEFNSIILSKDPTKANFAVPSHGLALKEVEYDWSVLQQVLKS